MKNRYKKQVVIKKQSSLLSTHTQCSFCSNYYSHMWGFSSGQASECASDIFWSKTENTHLITSSYGSNYDTSRFFIRDEKIIKQKHYEMLSFLEKNPQKSKEPVYAMQLNICDVCIAKFLKEGEIEEDTKYNYWEPLEKMNRLWSEDCDLYMKLISHGPDKCMALIDEELGKPVEQRLEERKERESNGQKRTLLKLTKSIFSQQD